MRPVPPAWVPLYPRQEMAHFWLRGLVPTDWTCAPSLASEEVVRTGYFVDPAAFDDQDVVFDTDGSGVALSALTRGFASVLGRLLRLFGMVTNVFLRVVSLGA